MAGSTKLLFIFLLIGFSLTEVAKEKDDNVLHKLKDVLKKVKTQLNISGVKETQIDPTPTYQSINNDETYYEVDTYKTQSTKFRVTRNDWSRYFQISQTKFEIPTCSNEAKNDEIIQKEIMNATDDERKDNITSSERFAEEYIKINATEVQENVTKTSEVEIKTKVEEISESLPKAKTEADKLEIYSQFAERITAEKKNGGTENHKITVPGKAANKTTKNYASNQCGAKVLSFNEDAQYPGRILNREKEDYMLTPCTKEKWVIIELCESIKLQRVDIANFEVFSNTPKDFQIFGSYRYPTKEWTLLGEFQGKEGSRDLQSFFIGSNDFIKYVKLEITSYYGSEFYCILSTLRLYGVSEFDAMYNMDYEDDDDIHESTIVGNSSVYMNISLSDIHHTIKRGSYENKSSEDELKFFTYSCTSLSDDFNLTDECVKHEYLNYILSCYGAEYSALANHSSMSHITKSFCRSIIRNFCHSFKTCYTYHCVMLTPMHVFAFCHIKYPTLLNRMYDVCNLTKNETAPVPNDTVQIEPPITDSPILSLPSFIVKNDTDTEKLNSTRTSKGSRSKNAKEVKADVSTETNEAEGVKDSSPTQNKETIAVRLGNRIKTLEHNMSIINQYLEELSLAFKRQMEEMQKQFNATILVLNKTSKLAFESDLNQQKHIDGLELRLVDLESAVNNLTDRNDTTYVIVCHVVFFAIELLVLTGAFFFCFKKAVSRHIPDMVNNNCCINGSIHKENGYLKNTSNGDIHKYTTTRIEELQPLEKESQVSKSESSQIVRNSSALDLKQFGMEKIKSEFEEEIDLEQSNPYELSATLINKVASIKGLDSPVITDYYNRDAVNPVQLYVPSRTLTPTPSELSESLSFKSVETLNAVNSSIGPDNLGNIGTPIKSVMPLVEVTKFYSKENRDETDKSKDKPKKNKQRKKKKKEK